MKKYILVVISCFLLTQGSLIMPFHYLYAPWRTDYILNTGHKPATGLDKETCIFCGRMAANTDDKFYIFRRFNHHIVILNKYPYNTGHLLIIPFEHIAHLEDASKEVRAELMELITHSVVILKDVLDAQGVNVGINLGRPAGAGIPGHLHVHLVPRWEGDTGFLDTTAETKLVPVDLDRVYEQLKPYFNALEI